MAIFGAYYALNPAKAATRVAKIHFWCYCAVVAIMSHGLYYYYLGFSALEPLLALSSMLAFLSVILFAFIVFSRFKVQANSQMPSVQDA